MFFRSFCGMCTCAWGWSFSFGRRIVKVQNSRQWNDEVTIRLHVAFWRELSYMSFIDSALYRLRFFWKEVPIRSRNNIFQFITGELSSLLLLCKINWGWRQVYVPISIDINEPFFTQFFSIKWCEILILFYSPLAPTFFYF